MIASGPTKTSIRTVAGLQVDLRVVQLDAWGAALQYFTGSQAHNVAVRQIAVRRKLRLSEYGLFEVETGELIVSRTEEEVYARLGLDRYRPRCARTTVRSRPRPPGRYHGSFGKMICAGTCIRTPT